MIPGRVSVIIPSRNERFLAKTVADVLSKSAGDLEVLTVLDGYWPDPPLPEDKRLRILHRGTALGMRPAINDAARVATGQYLLKCDAHVMFDQGFDEKLKADYADPSWVLIPRRYALEPESWTLDTSNHKYPIDYHYLSYPFERPGDVTCGLHGTPWTARREARRALALDEEMSSQGSCWFMSREQWGRVGELDIVHYGNFVHEFQEVGLRTWLGGGAVMVTKRTWYAHLYKGRKYGRGYILGPNGHKEGAAFCTRFWMGDEWPQRVRDLRWLIEKFSPVPTWPADLDEAFARARGAAPVHADVPKEMGDMDFQIRAARYGVSTKESADVTEVVKSLATADGLAIEKVSNDLLKVGGIYPGQRKRLVVDYTVDGVEKSASALERKSLRLPEA